MVSYVPAPGDAVWMQFDPQAGHEQPGQEQAGHRPARVLSPRRYNAMRGMTICCPMTSKIKGYVFEVVVEETRPSAILADQVKSLDWRARGAVRKGAVPPRILADVQAKIKALLRL
jgi:mRNA interferase MazF